MNYIDHDHKHTVKRGGSIMSGSSNYDDNITLDTPEYSKHDLSHSWKGTAKCGMINGVMNLHVLPGDSFRFHPSFSQKFRPMIAPIISQIENVEHTFYVPYRLCDYSFEKQLTGGVSGTFKRNLLHFACNHDNPITDIETDYTIFGISLFNVGSVADQLNLGVSCEIDENGVYNGKMPRFGTKFSCLSLVAYHRCYNDFYRPKEVETDLWCHIESDKNLLNYFTGLFSALESVHGGTIDKTKGFVAYRETIWTALHTRVEFVGFAEFMLWLLTDPDAMPMVKSYYNSASYPSGQTVAAYDAQKQRLLTKSIFNATRVWQTSYNTNVAAWIDFFAGVFALYLLSPEFFPWERDRATTALPYLMRGTSVALQSAIQANSLFDSVGSSTSNFSGIFQFFNPSTSEPRPSAVTNDSANVPLYTGFTIEELRRVNAMTRFLERNARIGYVFDEWLEGVFGISTKHADHLSRPVYVGGDKFTADVDTIISNASTDGAKLGDYSGFATAGSGCSFDFSVPEHGVILGLFSTKPRVGYLNAFDRNNAKYGDRTLFFTPDFAHLTEQPIFTAEIDCRYSLNQATSWLNDDWNDEDEGQLIVGSTCFGYEPRYNEYRSCFDTIHGELKTSLAYFSTARTAFDATLSEDNEMENDVFFQHVFPTMDCVNRIFQVDATMADHFVLSIGWGIDALRLVPREATPHL